MRNKSMDYQYNVGDIVLWKPRNINFSVQKVLLLELTYSERWDYKADEFVPHAPFYNGWNGEKYLYIKEDDIIEKISLKDLLFRIKEKLYYRNRNK